MDNQANQFFINFVSSIEQLKILTADYNTAFLNLSTIYKSFDNEELKKQIPNLSDEEKIGLLNLLNTIRRLSFTIKTDVESLKQDFALTETEEKTLEKTYETIETKVLFEYKQLKQFVQILNNIKVKHINVQALILNSEKEKKALEAMQTPNQF